MEAYDLTFYSYYKNLHKLLEAKPLSSNNTGFIELNVNMTKANYKNLCYLGFKSSNFTTAFILTKKFILTPNEKIAYDSNNTDFVNSRKWFLIPFIATKSPQIISHGNIKEMLTQLLPDVKQLKNFTIKNLITDYFFKDSAVSNLVLKAIDNAKNLKSTTILFPPNFFHKLHISYTLYVRSDSKYYMTFNLNNSIPVNPGTSVSTTRGINVSYNNLILGAFPFYKKNHGVGQTVVMDAFNIKPIYMSHNSDYVKFEILNGDYKGIYGIKQSPTDPLLWFISHIKKKQRPEFIKDLTVLKPIDRPEFKLEYKYTLSMKPKLSTYAEFERSMTIKHVDQLLNGSYELFVSPIYLKGSIPYTQITIDFDGSSSLAGVKAFLRKMKSVNLEDLFVVQCTGNGYHAKSLFAIKNLDQKQLRNLDFFKQFKGFDVRGSFKSVPLRSPWSYSKKRRFTNFAMLGSMFLESVNAGTKSFFYKKPDAFLQESNYKSLLKFFVCPQYFVTQDSTTARRFLSIIGLYLKNVE